MNINFQNNYSFKIKLKKKIKNKNKNKILWKIKNPFIKTRIKILIFLLKNKNKNKNDILNLCFYYNNFKISFFNRVFFLLKKKKSLFSLVKRQLKIKLKSKRFKIKTRNKKKRRRLVNLKRTVRRLSFRRFKKNKINYTFLIWKKIKFFTKLKKKNKIKFFAKNDIFSKKWYKKLKKNTNKIFNLFRKTWYRRQIFLKFFKNFNLKKKYDNLYFSSKNKNYIFSSNSNEFSQNNKPFYFFKKLFFSISNLYKDNFTLNSLKHIYVIEPFIFNYLLLKINNKNLITSKFENKVISSQFFNSTKFFFLQNFFFFNKKKKIQKNKIFNKKRSFFFKNNLVFPNLSNLLQENTVSFQFLYKKFFCFCTLKEDFFFKNSIKNIKIKNNFLFKKLSPFFIKILKKNFKILINFSYRKNKKLKTFSYFIKQFNFKTKKNNFFLKNYFFNTLIDNLIKPLTKNYYVNTSLTNLFFLFSNPLFFKTYNFFTNKDLNFKKFMIISNIFLKKSKIYTNILSDPRAFSFNFKKEIYLSSFSRKLNSIFSYLPYFTLIRFIEFYTGKKTLLKIDPFTFRSISEEDSTRCLMWSHKLKFFKKNLGSRFFLVESLQILTHSFRLKDPYILSNWMLSMFYKISFWKYKSLFRYLQYVLRNFFWPYFEEFGIKGIKFQLKGKVSVAGNARTRIVMIKIGSLSHSTYNYKVLTNLNLLRTFTGVIGFRTWLVF